MLRRGRRGSCFRILAGKWRPRFATGEDVLMREVPEDAVHPDMKRKSDQSARSVHGSIEPAVSKSGEPAIISRVSHLPS